MSQTQKVMQWHKNVRFMFNKIVAFLAEYISVFNKATVTF